MSAYLKHVEKCNVVDYKVRRPVQGIEAMNEIDVIGFHFEKRKVFLCEAKTHIMGLYMGKSNKDTIVKIRDQYNNMKLYADKYLKDFPNVEFQLWSPYVPIGVQTEAYKKMGGLELIINENYTKRIRELERIAGKTTKQDEIKVDTGNPFFRTLQILGHLR